MMTEKDQLAARLIANNCDLLAPVADNTKLTLEFPFSLSNAKLAAVRDYILAVKAELPPEISFGPGRVERSSAGTVLTISIHDKRVVPGRTDGTNAMLSNEVGAERVAEALNQKARRDDSVWASRRKAVQRPGRFTAHPV